MPAISHKVKATREGLVGHVTATGHRIQDDSFFVALPSTKALRRTIRLRAGNPERVILVSVLDVGPWNEHDEAYVFGDARPQTETGKDTRGRQTNGAGIDLSEGVCRALGWKPKQGSGEVTWEFVDAE